MKVKFINKVYALPCTLFLLSLAVLVARMIISQSLMFAFLIWNFILAAIPLVISVELLNTNNPSSKKLKVALLSLSWLLFLPNSFYIITDLKHLIHSGERFILLDTILILTFALNGSIMGFYSMYFMRLFAIQNYPWFPVRLVTASVLLLCGFGIYLGRILRWNSWDILIDPDGLFDDIARMILNPYDNFFDWLFILILSAFLGINYYFFNQYQELHNAIKHEV